MADVDLILRPAITAAVEAYNAEPDDPADQSEMDGNGIITSYVVIVETRGFDRDGKGVSRTHILVDDQAPLSVQLGLVTEAKIRYDAEILDAYRRG